MAKHIYILELRSDSGTVTEAWTSLKDVLKTVDLLHLYRSITYHIAKGNPFVMNNITIKRIDTKIETLDVINYQSSQIILRHGKHRN